MYIDEAHMALDIFRFAAFFIRGFTPTELFSIHYIIYFSRLSSNFLDRLYHKSHKIVHYFAFWTIILPISQMQQDNKLCPSYY